MYLTVPPSGAHGLVQFASAQIAFREDHPELTLNVCELHSVHNVFPLLYTLHTPYDNFVFYFDPKVCSRVRALSLISRFDILVCIVAIAPKRLPVRPCV